MRLLHATSKELVSFIEPDVPPSAIVSHTWDREEVTFQDIQTENASHKLGYAKVDSSCRLAGISQLEYVWIDTCCIDKSASAANSTELSEAINSMFRWYEKAEIWYPGCPVFTSEGYPALTVTA